MGSIIDDIYDVYDTKNLYQSIVSLYKIEQFIKTYLMIPLIILNIIGNGINIFIYSSKVFKRTSIGSLMICLSIADILNTYTLLYSYVNDKIQYDESYIRVLLYIYTVIPFLTPAISALIAIDRCISVVNPKMIPKLASKRNQLIVIGSLMLLFVLMNMATLFQDILIYINISSTVNNYHVQYTRDIYPWLNIVLASIVPFLIMCISNITTMVKLRQMKVKLNRSTGDTNRFIAIAITLNILFLVFYLPRYIVEFYRTRYDSTLILDILVDISQYIAETRYNLVIYDKLSIIIDYWKYLYSTITFLVYLLINKIYKKAFLEKLYAPYKKIVLILIFSSVLVSGFGFLIYYIATIGKIGPTEFCMSTNQCTKNMKCEYAKCVCEYNSVFYNNNTCKIPNNASLHKDLDTIFKSSKPELRVNELPESVLVKSFSDIISFEIVNINGTNYHYVLDCEKQAIIVFDEEWKFQAIYYLKSWVLSCYADMIVADNYIFIVSCGIYKLDLVGNLLNKYNETNNICYYSAYFNKTDNCLYAQNYIINRNIFHEFDINLNKLEQKHKLMNINSLCDLKYVNYKLYVSNCNEILVFEKEKLIKQIIPKSNKGTSLLVVDDYENIAYSSGYYHINLIYKNGSEVLNFYETDDEINSIGFDARNKLVVVKTKEIIVFN